MDEFVIIMHIPQSWSHCMDVYNWTCDVILIFQCTYFMYNFLGCHPVPLICIGPCIAGADPGGGGLWGLKPPPFIFRLYLINMLSIYNEILS